MVSVPQRSRLSIENCPVAFVWVVPDRKPSKVRVTPLTPVPSALTVPRTVNFEGDARGAGVKEADPPISAFYNRKTCVGVLKASPLVPHRTKLVGIPVTPGKLKAPTSAKVCMSNTRKIVVDPSLVSE